MAHADKKKSSSIKNPKTYEGMKKKGMPKSRAAAAATPQALAGLFPTNHRVDARTERATIDFYLQRAGDYVGRPMLSPLLGVYAAWNGDRTGAARWFEAGYSDFIEEPYLETNEFSRKRFSR